jgi:hypothetical protein
MLDYFDFEARVRSAGPLIALAGGLNYMLITVTKRPDKASGPLQALRILGIPTTFLAGQKRVICKLLTQYWEGDMAVSVEWEIKATEYANCNCSYGCPCQFNALPTHGDCKYVASFQIEKGHFGDVKLDGLRAVTMGKWPGPIHKGDGTLQVVIDERADARQRDALAKILSGQETEDMATMWWVFGAMSPTKLPPVFAKIELEVDVDRRTARLEVPGVISSKGEPIRNPVTGAEHRVRIDFPQSFEYRLGEIGSGTSKITGRLPIDLKDSWGLFARLHLSHKGRLN